MQNLNRNENNCINIFLIKSTIKKIAYYENNILVINNIDYFKKFFFIIEF